MITNTVKTIAAQVKAMGMTGRGVKLYAVDANTLRLHTANRYHVFNVDIIYRPGPDLYDVKVHHLNTRGYAVTTETAEEVYFDMLPEIVAELKEAAKAKAKEAKAAA